MKQTLMLSIIFLFFASAAIAQQIPLGSCGIVYIHDAAGNRTRRVYFCNNGGAYPQRPAKANTPSTVPSEVQFVTALYPNPTTGLFTINFSTSLKNAPVSIFDVNGKLIQQQRMTGNNQQFNLSGVSAGIYFIKIIEGKRTIEIKVIKE